MYKETILLVDEDHLSNISKNMYIFADFLCHLWYKKIKILDSWLND